MKGQTLVLQCRFVRDLDGKIETEFSVANIFPEAPVAVCELLEPKTKGRLLVFRFCQFDWFDHATAEANIDAEADDSAVIPFTPATTYTGAPIAGITGSLSLGGSEFPITAFDVTVANNIKPLDDEAFQQFPDDIIPGFREVTGNISIRARKDYVIQMGKRESFSTQAIAVVFGSGTNGTWTLTIPQAEIMFAAAAIPQDEEGVISIPYKALATSTSAIDEFTLVFS